MYKRQVYYYDDEGIEYQIALAAGNRFTFWVMGENLSGEYTLTGTELVFDFTGDKADLTATLSDEVITLEYSGAQLRFLKKLADVYKRQGRCLFREYWQAFLRCRR